MQRAREGVVRHGDRRRRLDRLHGQAEADAAGELQPVLDGVQGGLWRRYRRVLAWYVSLSCGWWDLHFLEGAYVVESFLFS